jgi:hypothetical protein
VYVMRYMIVTAAVLQVRQVGSERMRVEAKGIECSAIKC